MVSHTVFCILTLSIRNIQMHRVPIRSQQPIVKDRTHTSLQRT